MSGLPKTVTRLRFEPGPFCAWLPSHRYPMHIAKKSGKNFVTFDVIAADEVDCLGGRSERPRQLNDPRVIHLNELTLRGR